jgi:DNA-binding PadR family transcriptional regulator
LLLGLLSGGPKHGYDLKRTHDAHLPLAKPLAFGQVYATLGRLQRDGLVVTAGTDREGGPDRTSYELTEEGRRVLDAWLATVEPPLPHLTSALLTKVVIAVLVAGADQARALLAAQRRAHVERLRELTAIKTNAAASLGNLLAADFGIAHLDADLRWLHTALDRMADLAREVGAQ